MATKVASVSVRCKRLKLYHFASTLQLREEKKRWEVLPGSTTQEIEEAIGVLPYQVLCTVAG
ncbi:hypothetical protein SLEP1_g55544 [Rubroshorea leprosula]|uniref:Uncharacterized protein n=1 Tax=Rubroshorea leprosula TaxID=152421 RepID=A0AAV5MFT2_9ROSI|nr:hypothetical protein SLEP1_g55544 [Rubroshorea leprosula]